MLVSEVAVGSSFLAVWIVRSLYQRDDKAPTVCTELRAADDTGRCLLHEMVTAVVAPYFGLLRCMHRAPIGLQLSVIRVSGTVEVSVNFEGCRLVSHPPYIFISQVA